jgi:hypothetical protein
VDLSGRCRPRGEILVHEINHVLIATRLAQPIPILVCIPYAEPRVRVDRRGSLRACDSAAQLNSMLGLSGLLNLGRQGNAAIVDNALWAQELCSQPRYAVRLVYALSGMKTA